jgi:hypothetical protein
MASQGSQRPFTPRAVKRARVFRTRFGAALLLAAALSACVSSTAAGGAQAIISLSVGDGLSIAGSKIQCGVSANVGYGLKLAGQTYIVCGPSTHVKGGGYIALIESDGRVVILSVKTQKSVSSRAPAAVGAQKGMSTARIGDVVVLKGTSIMCDAIRVGGKPTLICDYVNAKGVVRANSYSFGISDAIVSSLKWDAAKHVHVLRSWSEG